MQERVGRRVSIAPKSSVSKHESQKKEGVSGRSKKESWKKKKKKFAHSEG